MWCITEKGTGMSTLSKGAIELTDKKKMLLKRLLQKEAAERLAQQQETYSAGRQSISPRLDRSAYPLSLSQQRIWWLEQLTAGDPALQMQTALRFKGQLDKDVLLDCVQTLIE